MKWAAYGLVGVCSGAFVGWGSYVSFVEPALIGDGEVSIWLRLLAAVTAALIGAVVGAAGAVLFGWAISSRRD